MATLSFLCGSIALAKIYFFLMAFQAAKDTSIILNKKHKEEAFYWSSIRIVFVINENFRQKLMAVNEIRVVVYKYSVE